MTLSERLLVIGPSWVGDAVMATPALRLLRESLPGVSLHLLTKPPVDKVLAGCKLLDAVRAERPRGSRQRASLTQSIRQGRYDAALLLSNSFGSAWLARNAGISERVGYARDARSCLLTRPLRAPERPGSAPWRRRWAITPAVDYYLGAAAAMVGAPVPSDTGLMTLSLTDEDRAEAARLRAAVGLDEDQPTAIVNPGGNNPAKRWPAGRFAALADHLHEAHGLAVLVNGSPAEADLARSIAAASAAHALPEHGGSIPGLKGLMASARLVVTNDTGPRHIAAALQTPVVTLFGPTDHRWTTIPTKPLADGGPSERIVLADPSLPEAESANDHPERCSIERIELSRVIEACDELLEAG